MARVLFCISPLNLTASANKNLCLVDQRIITADNWYPLNVSPALPFQGHEVLSSLPSSGTPYTDQKKACHSFKSEGHYGLVLHSSGDAEDRR